MDAAARPVRRPPSSCLSDWVAPCMRRFNSLMSKPGVGRTLSPPSVNQPPTLTGPRIDASYKVSAGDNRAVPGTAQDRTNRTRLCDREYDDRQRSLAGKRE